MPGKEGTEIGQGWKRSAVLGKDGTQIGQGWKRNPTPSDNGILIEVE